MHFLFLHFAAHFSIYYAQNLNFSKFSSKPYLKVVSTTFLLVCFSSLKKNTCEIWKNVFYFSSKALFVLEKITFQYFIYSNFMTSSNA